MATVPYEAVPVPGSLSKLVVWRGLTSEDVGTPLALEKTGTAQFSGVFGGPVFLEAALDPGKDARWFTLHSRALVAIEQVPPVTQVRPRAGQGVKKVDVWLFVPA